MKNFSFNPPNGFEEFNVPLLGHIFEFYKTAYNYIQLFPQKDKYTLGKNIENLTLEILKLVFLAGNSSKEEKLDLLKQASANTDLLKIMVRLAKEVKATDIKKYVQLQEKLQEIGRMLGGWIRSLRH